MFMTLEELRAMTRATHTAKVCRVLTELGVAWKPDNQGEPIVLRAVVERMLGLAPDNDIGRGADINMAERLARLKGTSHGKKKAERSRAS